MKIIKPTWPQPKNIQALTTTRNCNIENLNLPSNKFWIKQNHGINILQATSNPLEIPIADGSYTVQKNIVCIIKTADCLPILITNLQGTFVGAIHAGWRGLANDIINNFFIEIKSLNLKLTDLLFWLGPAIGPLVFEVGEDVLEKFNINLYQSAFKKTNNLNKYLANIYQIATIALLQYGINKTQIFSENWCTYSRNDLFYSYRREPSDSNRMHSVIWIE